MDNTATTAPLLYDPATTAHLLSVSRATRYKLLDPDPITGRPSLPSVKVGRSRRITREALLDFVGSLAA
jgi:excisionase family DNA binding protein